MTSSLVLPNVVIAGLGRSGTTSMFQYLIEHPSVCGSQKKETRFFEYALYGRPQPPLERYSSYFDHFAGESVVAEASPGYFSGGHLVAKEIDRTLGADCKVVIIFREPVARLTSFYNMSIARMHIDDVTTLDQYVAACEAHRSVRETGDEGAQIYQGYYGGFYADALPDWHEVFGERLRIEFFDELQKDPGDFMVGLSKWLGIDPAFYTDRNFEVQNPGVGFRRAWLHKIANKANDRAEFMLRRNPNLKNRVRRVYGKLNSQAVKAERPSPELTAHLTSVYADSNRRTREQLVAMGYTDLPGWLASV
jgi:hypothetical protein